MALFLTSTSYLYFDAHLELIHNVTTQPYGDGTPGLQTLRGWGGTARLVDGTLARESAIKAFLDVRLVHRK